MIDAFPKLKEGGGYELLRREKNARYLTVIPPPSRGYTALYLKSVVGLAKIFVHTLQKDFTAKKRNIY